MKKYTLLLIFLSAAIFASCINKKGPVAPYTPLSQFYCSPTITLTITMTKQATNTLTATQTNIPTSTITATFTGTATSSLNYSEMVEVGGATFTQTDGVNSFIHSLSSFRIGKYEVIYDIWYTVYQWAISNGYVFANAGIEGSGGIAGASPTTNRNQPVSTINWRDIVVWCNAYSQMSGFEPVYYSDAGFATPIKDSTDGAFGSSIDTTQGSVDNPYVKWSANGYRLPTEGETMYVASYINGASWTPYNYASGATADYSDTAATNMVVWYQFNSSGSAHNVGLKNPNAIGVYDLSGNMFEFLWDWYGSYPAGPETNYRGPSSGSSKFVFGGSFCCAAYHLAIGERETVAGTYAESSVIGFRLARSGLN